jgi:F-type H+-transporting ATPase subunit delta
MKTTRQARREAHQLWQICATDGVLDAVRARAVADQIVQSRRGGSHAVLKAFLRLLRLDQEARTAVVASAAPLDPAVRAEIERGLARLHRRGLETRFVVDPSLIGGMRVQIGCDVYDGSVRGGLAALESGF